MPTRSPITEAGWAVRPAATIGTIPDFGYGGVKIRQSGEHICLTDMWRAAGSPDGRRPNDWLALSSTAEFREAVEASLIAGNSGILAKAGRGGGTFAHWQIALAYAKYLSPEFHMWCNTIVRSHMERHHAGSADLPAAGPAEFHMPTVRGLISREVRVQIAGFVEEEFADLVAIEVRRLAPAAIEGITAGEVIAMAGFDDQAGLKGLARIVSDRLRRFHAQRGVAIREKTLGRTRAYIFDRVTCREWLAAGGKATIMQCVAERRGQGRLRLA